MVVVTQDRLYTGSSPSYTVAAAPPPKKGRGLVSSRVQFFELSESQRRSIQSEHEDTPREQNAYVSEQRAFLQPPLFPSSLPSSETREPVSISPPSRRRRYPDSFSNDLPVIEETRQDFHSSPLIEVGIEHYNREEYVMAEKAFKTALKTDQANGSEDKSQSALVMSNLGAVYLKQNKFEAANQFLETSLEIKKTLGENVAMSDTYNNLGNSNFLMGRLDEALEYYRLALHELREKRGQKKDVADILFNIGRLEIYRENWVTARDVLQEASRMTKEAYTDNLLYVAEASDLMAFVQLTMGQTEEALTSFTKALEIYRDVHGPLHVDVANAIFNIGLVREASEEYSEAWEAYNTALELHRKLGSSLGDPEFKKVRTSIANVEKLVAQQQNQARLVQRHQEAITKKKKPKEKQVRLKDEATIIQSGNAMISTTGKIRQL